MGWTWTCEPELRWEKGNTKKKAFLDNEYTWEGKETKMEVIKSSMVGNTYYAAAKQFFKGKNDERVIAIVCLTQTANYSSENFGWKGMTEFDGPVERKCPVGILNLLSETDDKWALKWREECKELRELKKSVSSFKVGDQIRTKLWHDDEMVLTLVDWYGKGKSRWESEDSWYRKSDVFKYPFEIIKKETL